MIKQQSTMEVASTKLPALKPIHHDEPTPFEDLCKRIKQSVRRATSGRIHNLAVTVTGTHVVLEGFCSTYHCFQLAQHAAMQLADELSVDNQIQVL